MKIILTTKDALIISIILGRYTDHDPNSQAIVVDAMNRFRHQVIPHLMNEHGGNINEVMAQIQVDGLLTDIDNG